MEYNKRNPAPLATGGVTHKKKTPKNSTKLLEQEGHRFQLVESNCGGTVHHHDSVEKRN